LSCAQITTNDDKVYYKYCGDDSKIPKILTLDATSVYLTFLSDDSATRGGFKIAYSILTRKG